MSMLKKFIFQLYWYRCIIGKASRTFLRAAAYFTDVTLAEKDGQPPAAHSVILREVRPNFKKFLKENSHSNHFVQGDPLKSTPPLIFQIQNLFITSGTLRNSGPVLMRSCT